MSVKDYHMIDKFILSNFDTFILFNNYRESFVSNEFLTNDLIVCFHEDITYMVNTKSIIDKFDSLKHR